MATLPPPEKSYRIGRDCPVCCDELPTLEESVVWSEHCRHRLHLPCLESWHAKSTLCPVCGTFRPEHMHPPTTWKHTIVTTGAVVLLMGVILVVSIGITAVIVGTGDKSMKRKAHRDNPRDPARQAKNEQALSVLDWSTIDASFEYVVIDDGEIICWAKSASDVMACLPRGSYDALLVGRPGTWTESRPRESMFFP